MSKIPTLKVTLKRKEVNQQVDTPTHKVNYTCEMDRVTEQTRQLVLKVVKRSNKW